MIIVAPSQPWKMESMDASSRASSCTDTGSEASQAGKLSSEGGVAVDDKVLSDVKLVQAIFTVQRQPLFICQVKQANEAE